MAIAKAGCRTRRRSSTCDVGERSAASASARLRDGNSVSPSAAMAPLTPTISRAPSKPAMAAVRPGRAVSETTSPPDSHQAVSASQATRMNVLVRWTAMNSARAMLALSATSSNSTRPAPTAASVSMKITVIRAPRLAG